jgi:hypothetical protein
MEENEVMVTNDVNEVEASNVSVPEVIDEEPKGSLGTYVLMGTVGGLAIYGGYHAVKTGVKLAKKGGKALKTAVGNLFAKKADDTVVATEVVNESDEEADK